MKLYKTTITILTDYDPAGCEITDLARNADCGDAYCYGQETTLIDANDLDGEGVKEFFMFEEVPEVYQSEFGWGFVGCDSDCYATKEEAEEAAKNSVEG